MEINKQLNSFTSQVDKVERALSLASSIPVTGILAGTIKVTLAIGQTLMGAALLAFASLAKLFTKRFDLSQTYRECQYFGMTHLLHGLFNIGAGTLEALPGLGSFVFLKRMMRVNSSNERHYKILDAIFKAQSFKFMPYKVELNSQTRQVYVTPAA